MKKPYYIISIMLTIIVSTTDAQIVYTDISDGVPVGIDFNSDATNEFDLTSGPNPGDYIDYTNYGADNNIHAIGTIGTQDWDVPDCVASGFTVDASNQWEGQGDCSLNAWGAGNSTITQNQDEYLAVRFNLGGTDLYYGWIRFSMDNAGMMTYKDYAYNATPNTAINAGDTGAGTGISEISNNDISIYPNPTSNYLTVSSDLYGSVDFQIYSIIGEHVLQGNLAAINNQINLSTLPPNMYILKIGNLSVKVLKTE